MRIDDDIIALGRRLRDLEGLPESQVEQIIRDYFARAGRDNLEQYLENITESIEDIREEFEEARDDLRELERGEERDQAEDDLDEVKKYLREFEQLVDEVYQGVTDHFRDFTNGADVNIGSDSLEINAENNGSTYIYTLSGANNSPFGAGSEANPLEGVTRDGTATGEVIKDVNVDQRLSYADIEKAIADANMARLDQQNVFINTDPSWHWELVPGSSDTTFRVTNGEFSTLVTFENSANATFYFQSGITEEDVTSGALEQWGDLLDRSFWGDSTKTFRQEMNPISDVDRLGAIPGYDDLNSDDARAAVATANYTDGSLTGAAETGYTEAVRLIFDYIDSGATDVTTVWTDIMDAWNELGLSQEERSLVIQYLITMTFLHARNIFTEFVAKASAQLQGLMTYAYSADQEPTVGEKVAILILETQGAPSGQYDLTTLMQTLFRHQTEGPTSVEAEWTDNDSNVDALQKVGQLIAAGGGVPIQGLADVRALEETALNPDMASVELTQNETNAMLAEVALTSYTDDMLETDGDDSSSLSDGVSASSLRQHISAILAQITERPMTAQEMRQTILTAIGNLGDRENNDVANVLIDLLHEYAPELLRTLVNGDEGTTWATQMWNHINDNDPRMSSGYWGNDTIWDGAEHRDTARANLLALNSALNLAAIDTDTWDA